MRGPTLMLFGAVAAAGLGHGCQGAEGSSAAVEPRPAANAVPVAAPAPPYENVMPRDYVGPQACRECHEELYEQWQSHPHSRMNQNATPEAVVGDFSGIAVSYGGVKTTFDREGDTFFMTYELDGVRLRRDRITRTIGSKLQQAYVGIQVEGPEPAGHALYSTERALPFVYWFSRKAWFPEHYVEQYPEPEYDEQGELRYPTADPYSRGTRPWNEGCLLCHNTYPYAFRLVRDFPGTGFEGVAARAGAAGLPDGGPTPEDLVTLGVSCESCHFGGREHVEHEREVVDRPMSSVLSQTTVIDGGAAVTSICAQCHVAGTLPYPNGASSVNSSEALDMMRGACASKIGCTDCHDPHTGHIGAAQAKRTASDPEATRAAESKALQACVDCHPDFRDETARRRHARHDAGAASCLDCHMAPITQGIDAVVRSHRIDSPTNRDMLAAGAPNACNLCHLDRSLQWTLERLSEDWGVAVQPDEGWAQHYGEGLERPAAEVWLRHETPIHRLVAASAHARRPTSPPQLRRLLDILLDPYPNNRMFGLFAVEALVGRRLEPDEYTPTADVQTRQRQVRALARRLVAEQTD